MIAPGRILELLSNLLEPATFAALRRVYYGKNAQGEFDGELGCIRYHKPPDLDDATWRRLCEGPLPPNDFRSLDHDELVARIIAADRALSWEDVFEGFVLGCSGRWPRGRQTLISAAYARNLEPHRFDNPGRTGSDAACHVCSIPKRTTLDRTDTIFRLYWGYAWNEMPARWVYDLEERAEAEPMEVTDADRSAFVALLHAIDDAEPNETPGKLEKRLGKAKLLPGTDKYRRYGILSGLAEVGVLPNALLPPMYERLPSRPEVEAARDALTTSHRSDVLPPLAGWRGEMGVNWGQTRALFGAWVGSD